MIYNIHYDICAVVISLFSVVFMLLKKGFRQRQNFILFGLFCVTLGAALFDILSSVANSYMNDWTDFSRNFMNYGYLAIQNTMPYLLCCYVVYVIGLSFRFGKKQIRLVTLLMSIPLGIIYILLLINPFTGIVFYYDENKIYSHGAGMTVMYAIAFLYLFTCYLILVKYSKRATRNIKIMVIAFITASVLSVIAQIIFPTLLIQLCVEALCLLGLLVTIDNEAEIVDKSTTCYNRQRFLRDIRLGLENSSDYRIVLVKISNFKSYSSSFSMNELDKIMRQIGLWLRRISNDIEGYYCDYGCFALVCDRSVEINVVLKTIKDRFSQPFISEKTAVEFRPDLYVLRAGKDFKDIEQLMQYISQDDQRGSSLRKLRRDSVDQIADSKKEIIMERAIQRALKFDEFEIMYQPIWDAKNNMLSEAEALIRLYDDADGLISPESFIPYAERRGYIVEIGEYVFESVCRFMATHDLKSIGIEHIHMNLSPYQCRNKLIVDRFENIRKKYKVAAEMLVFEISETNIPEDYENVENIVKKLHSKGYTVALDNFGKDAFNMSYLFDLQFEILKIDKSFFWKAEDNVKANIYFANTMRMAKEMNVKTVVVGVEAAAQKSLLQNYECDYLQGYYYQKALAEEEFYRYCVGFNSK